MAPTMTDTAVAAGVREYSPGDSTVLAVRWSGTEADAHAIIAWLESLGFPAGLTPASAGDGLPVIGLWNADGELFDVEVGDYFVWDGVSVCAVDGGRFTREWVKAGETS